MPNSFLASVAVKAEAELATPHRFVRSARARPRGRTSRRMHSQPSVCLLPAPPCRKEMSKIERCGHHNTITKKTARERQPPQSGSGLRRAVASRPHPHKNPPTPSPTRPHTRQHTLRAEVVELSEAQVAYLKRAQAEEAQRLVDGNAAAAAEQRRKSERCVLEIYPDKPSNDSDVYKCPRCNFHNLYRGGACNKLCCGNKTCNELFCIKCFKPAHMLCAHMLAAHMHAW